MPPFPGHGLSAGARLRDRSAASSRRAPRPELQVGDRGLRARRALLRRRCAACSAARPRGSSCPRRALVAASGRRSAKGRAARARRHRLHARAGARAGRRPDLIVGHGVLGRLLARLAVAAGGKPPVVWEKNPGARRRRRRLRASSIPSDDERRDYRTIYDVSGDARDSRHADAAARARRRDRARRLLRRPLSLRVSRPPSCARRAFRIAAQWRPGRSRRRSGDWSKPGASRSTA